MNEYRDTATKQVSMRRKARRRYRSAQSSPSSQGVTTTSAPKLFVPFLICADLSSNSELALKFVRAFAATSQGLGCLAATVLEEDIPKFTEILRRSNIGYQLSIACRADRPERILESLANSYPADTVVIFSDICFSPGAHFLEMLAFYMSLYSPEYVFFNINAQGARRIPYEIVTKPQLSLYGPLSPVMAFRPRSGIVRFVSTEHPDIPLALQRAFRAVPQQFDAHDFAETWIEPRQRAALWRHIEAAPDSMVAVVARSMNLVFGPKAPEIVADEVFAETAARMRLAFRTLGFPHRFDEPAAFERRQIILSPDARALVSADLLRDEQLMNSLTRSPDEASLNPIASNYQTLVASNDADARPDTLSTEVGSVRKILRRIFKASATQYHSRFEAALLKSKLFDPDRYLADNLDVAKSDFDPMRHYVTFGAKEQRRPGPYFEPKRYQILHQGVIPSGENEAEHYLLSGARAGLIAPTSRWAMSDRGKMLARRNLSLGPDARFDRRLDRSITSTIQRKGARKTRPSVLCCIPYMTAGFFTLRILDRMLQNNMDCYLAVYYPASEGGYKEDEGPWSERYDRVYRLFDLVAAEEVFDFLCYIIASQRVETLLIAGASKIYPFLPALRARFPRLRVLDQIFNPIGHTRRLLTFIEYIDVVIVENTEMTEFLKARNVPHEKICEIRSGVDLARFSRDARFLRFNRTDLFPPHIKTVVGYVGRMSEEKDPLGFVKIARLTVENDPTIGILIAGGGPQFELVRAAASAAVPATQLAFFGFQDDVRSTMTAVDLLVIPSRIDGRPVAVMEANALGTPVIASRVGGIPDMIKEGQNGMMFMPGAYSDAARILGCLARDPRTLSALKASTETLARAAFDQEEMYRLYRAALDPSTVTPKGRRRKKK